MPLTWDSDAARKFELGIDHGVFYPMGANSQYSSGVPWDGLINVSLSPTGGDVTKLRADNIVYGSLRSVEEMEGSITCYTTPSGFEAADGRVAVTVPQSATSAHVAGQNRGKFAFGFRSEIHDGTGTKKYKVTYVYGCSISPSERTYETITDSPDAQQLSYNFTADGMQVTGIDKPVAVYELVGAAIDVEETLPTPTALSGG